jgi:Protein of unknown function (DUF3309)
MTSGTVLLIVVVLVLLSVIPAWPHARRWSFGPDSVVGLMAVVVLVLLLSGNL